MRIDGNTQFNDYSQSVPSNQIDPVVNHHRSTDACKVEISDYAKQIQSANAKLMSNVSSEEIELVAASEEMISEVSKIYSPQSIRSRKDVVEEALPRLSS